MIFESIRGELTIHGVRRILDEIEELVLEREHVANGPLTRAEIQDAVKDEIKAPDDFRRELKQGLTRFRNREIGRVFPRAGIGRGRGFSFILVSEKDLAALVSELADSGLSPADRARRVSEFDHEIEKRWAALESGKAL